MGKFFTSSNYLNFVLIIPVINAIADITTNFFPENIISPGNIRATLIGIFIILILLHEYPGTRASRIIIIFLLYLAFLIPLSSRPGYSFNLYLKVLLSTLMYPIGYLFCVNQEIHRRINVSYLFLALIVCINIILANIFGFGSSDYLEGSFYFGATDVNITKQLSIVLLSSPLILLINNSRRERLFAGLILITSLVFSILGLKRGVILALITGFLVYSILGAYKGVILRSLIIAVFILFVFFPLYQPVLLPRYESRRTEIEQLEDEARRVETREVIQTFRQGDLKHKFIGSQLFNSQQFFHTERALHIDYNVIFNGSGIIGLAIYIILYIFIVLDNHKRYRFNKKDKYYRNLNAVFWSLIMASLIVSISGSIHAFTFRSMLFFYLGALTRLQKEGAIIKLRKISLQEE
jgi:MFS family permease